MKKLLLIVLTMFLIVGCSDELDSFCQVELESPRVRAVEVFDDRVLCCWAEFTESCQSFELNRTILKGEK